MILVIVIFIILVISIIRAALFIDQVCVTFVSYKLIAFTWHILQLSHSQISNIYWKDTKNWTWVQFMILMVKKSNGKYLHHLFRQWMKKKDIIMSRNKNTKYVYFKF